MTTVEDEKQNMKIQEIETDIRQIKNITHGSKELGWGGIISEHRALAGNVNEMVTSFKSIWRAGKWLIGSLATLAGGILALITSGIIKI